jgi:hypothetical protein
MEAKRLAISIHLGQGKRQLWWQMKSLKHIFGELSRGFGNGLDGDLAVIFKLTWSVFRMMVSLTAIMNVKMLPLTVGKSQFQV